MFGKGYNKKVPYQTPHQKAIEKRAASKAGKAIVPMLQGRYPTNEEKLADDPELIKFLELIS